MSHHQPQTGMMPPDSHAVMRNNTSSPTTSSSSPSDNTTPTPTSPSDPSALLTLMAIGPTPTPTPPPSSEPGGILGKGNGVKKRVSFRDNLVSVREIPPRPHRKSSSEDDGEDEDDSDEGEDSGSSVSDDDSEEDSESEEEEEEGKRGVRRHAGTITAGGKALTVSCRSVAKARTSPTNSSLSPSSPRARADRTHVPTSTAANASNVTSAKGSYHVTSSPTSRGISIVSQITGVSSVATQTHIKQRSKAAATMAKSATASPKQVTAVLRVEKKVKRISPNLDSASSPQTVRAAQNKDGAPTMAAAVGKGGPGKCAKKKRVSIRKQDAVEKRKPATFRKTKEMKNTAKVDSSENVNGTVAGPVKYKFVVNALSTVRDSLSLPPLGGGGGGGGGGENNNNNTTPLLPAAKTLQPHAATRVKTPIFSVDGFIFPGDLATGVKVKNTTGKAEDTKLTLPVPRSTRERWTRTPPGSPGRRKRCHAWQMANGDLESSLQEPPSITPMWETVTPMGGHSTTTTTTTTTSSSSPPLSSR